MPKRTLTEKMQYFEKQLDKYILEIHDRGLGEKYGADLLKFQRQFRNEEKFGGKFSIDVLHKRRIQRAVKRYCRRIPGGFTC